MLLRTIGLLHRSHRGCHESKIEQATHATHRTHYWMCLDIYLSLSIYIYSQVILNKFLPRVKSRVTLDCDQTLVKRLDSSSGQEIIDLVKNELVNMFNMLYCLCTWTWRRNQGKYILFEIITSRTSQSRGLLSLQS